MSYLEFFGTLLNILCVWLVARRNIWNWPVGIISVLFFGLLFYQIRLYSDLIEQIYYLITGFYGWWLWHRESKTEKLPEQKSKYIFSKKITQMTTLGIIVAGTAMMGYFVARIHIYFPSIFPVAASFPYLDAFTTVMSFVAQILMAWKRIECWLLWIAVDIIGIGLYYAKGVKFVSLLYLIFLIIATKGLINWYREYMKNLPRQTV